ncbi:short-chain dehydrogenase/reductase family 16C member 6-like [Pteropus medius]|uniref:short-chain dehydrogenase/reductase family 16C member 6-like n=1 Tax=Pteropus vampyrus TaxID=132908 RepID=UPI00196AD521|nr:short-chain dehydrogenase/reductase family 16C member 6-like [Pteropus giganteus]
MEAIWDTSLTLGKLLYYFLDSSVYKIIPKRKKNVAGEIVLITGAGSGIGRQTAIIFASLGATVVLWGINEEDNMETCRLAKEKGGVKVFAYKCDCSNRQEIYRVADQVKKEVGDVTILINNAGIVVGKLFLDIPDEMVEKSFLVNVLSHFWTYKAFLPAMIKANHGHLVCISSAAGLFGIGGLTEYSSTKFAAFGLTEALLFELKMINKSKINTTIVCPLFVNTGMFDGVTIKYPFLLPLLEQEYVAQKIVNAVLEEQNYLIIPKRVWFLVILKQLLSVSMTSVLVKFFGVDTCMDLFRERMKAKEAVTETKKKHQN